MFIKKTAYEMLFIVMSLILLAFAFHYLIIAFVPNGFCMGVLQ